MKILIISSHPISDNRINKHITTLLKNDFSVVYRNYSIDSLDNFKLKDKVELVHIETSFEKRNLFRVLIEMVRLRRYIKRSDAEIVHIHDPFFLLVFKLVKSKGVITVFDKHERYESIGDFNAKVATYLEKKYRKYIDSVIYVTEQQETYLRFLGLTNMYLIPNFQSKVQFDKIESRKDDKVKTLVYIGDLSTSTRDIFLMLEVMEKVMSSDNNVMITIGGEASGIVLSKILELSKKFHKLHYLGRLSYDKVIEITKSSDIGFYFQKKHPNNYMSSPNKIFEYLCSGVVLVGVGDFTLHDNIDNACGLLYNFGTSADKISFDIINLLNNEKMLRRYQSNALQLGANFTWEAIEERYMLAYYKKRKA